MAGFDLRSFEQDRVFDMDGGRERRHEQEEIREREEVRRLEREPERAEALEFSRGNSNQRRLREECIIAFKVYDQCRQQDCLTEDELGPARAAECFCIGDERFDEGDVINPPHNAAAVTIDRLRIKRIIIVEKKPNEFRRGFWDIDLKYVFEYRLTFRDADGEVIASVRANSIFNKQVILFGSVGEHLVIATDLLNNTNGQTLDAEPFVLVEARPMALEARIRYQRRVNRGPEDFSPDPNSVNVTIGLFTIIKLFRIVNLTVESRGFCIPEECEEIASEPCDIFDDMDFPMDVFAPPQKEEFVRGISGNIPRNPSRDDRCGCRD